MVNAIELSGFKDIDDSDMTVIKKKLENFVKDMSGEDIKFQRIHMTLKKVHEREDHQIFEIQAKLTCKETFNSDVDDRNLLTAVDKVLKKLTSQLEHHMHG